MTKVLDDVTKVLVDLTYLRHIEVGGSETYVSGIVGPLIARQKELKLELAFLGTKSALDAVGIKSDGPYWIHHLAEPPDTGGFWLVVASTTGVKQSKRFVPDVVWSPGNYQAWTFRWPHVITIHDLLHRNTSRMLPRGRSVMRFGLFPESLLRAKKVLVLSDRVSGDLERLHPHLVKRGQKIEVISPGTDHVAKHLEGEIPPDLAAAGVVPGNYTVYPAMFERHKNHDLLLRAYAEARKQGLEDHLVLTGARGPMSDEVVGRVGSLGLSDHVHIGAQITNHADVLAIMKHSKAVVFPSLHEGYAFGVSEAVALGTDAVVAEDIPASKLFKGHVREIGAKDERAWTEELLVIGRRNGDRPDRTDAIEAAANYTWDEAAEKTAEVFRKAKA